MVQRLHHTTNSERHRIAQDNRLSHWIGIAKEHRGHLLGYHDVLRAGEHGLSVTHREGEVENLEE